MSTHKKRLKIETAFPIGSYITFKQAYPIKCRDRFIKTFPIDDTKDNLVTANPTPLDTALRSGLVIGYRWVIMSDYKYIPSKQIDETEFSIPYSAGNREVTLLVVKDGWSKPFYVRIQDVTLL